MGEFEILDTDEPLPKRIERHAFDRLIMLSDGVFAIAITLLALEVKPPRVWTGDVADLLAQSWRSLFGFTLGFVIVSFYWIGHRRMFARLRRVDAPATLLTLLWLGLVSLAPAVVELMAMQGPKKSLGIYFMAQGATTFVQALLWGYAAFIGKLVDASITTRERLAPLVAILVLAVLFCVIGALAGSNSSESVMYPVFGVVVAALLARRFLLPVDQRA